MEKSVLSIVVKVCVSETGGRRIDPHQGYFFPQPIGSICSFWLFCHLNLCISVALERENRAISVKMAVVSKSEPL